MCKYFKAPKAKTAFSWTVHEHVCQAGRQAGNCACTKFIGMNTIQMAIIPTCSSIRSCALCAVLLLPSNEFKNYLIYILSDKDKWNICAWILGPFCRIVKWTFKLSFASTSTTTITKLSIRIPNAGNFRAKFLFLETACTVEYEPYDKRMQIEAKIYTFKWKWK